MLPSKSRGCGFPTAPRGARRRGAGLEHGRRVPGPASGWRCSRVKEAGATL